MNPQPSAYVHVAAPGAYWLSRGPVVVDCSVMAAVLWAEPAAPQAVSLISGKSLHAPQLLAYELANVARNKSRSGVPQDDALAGLAAFAEQIVVLHRGASQDPRALWALAERYQLSAYDAAYLLLATVLQAPLLTFDKKLSDAARRHLSPPG